MAVKECSLPVEEQVRLINRLQHLERRVQYYEVALQRKYKANMQGGYLVRTNNIKRLEDKIARAKKELENKRNGYRQLGLEV